MRAGDWYSFTREITDREAVIRTGCAVSQAWDLDGPTHSIDFRNNPNNPPPMYPFAALWDTGATGSVISQTVVDACELKPIGFATVSYVDGTHLVERYLVNIMLPNEVVIPNVRATKGKLSGMNFDVLIGMDIITQGDLVLTHIDGQTSFSFRVPSQRGLDFVPGHEDCALDDF